MNSIEELSKTVRSLRIEQGVSTYDLQKGGFHSSLPRMIEKGNLNVRVNTLLRYLDFCGLKMEITKKTE